MLMLHVDDEASVGDFRLGKQTLMLFCLGTQPQTYPSNKITQGLGTLI